MSSADSNRMDDGKTRTVCVNLQPRPYDVVIGRRVVGEGLGQALYRLGITGRAAILYDPAVEWWSGATDMDLQISLHAKNELYAVQPGEPGKTLDQYGKILHWLAERKFTRHETVVALGGGVIGDLAGFVAATYLRGVHFVQVPTTLLAMVDSSVGGKTGVNLPEGKNLVGAFHQPCVVVADLDVLATLPATEFAAGMAEVIKCGAIRDRALFDRVTRAVTPQDEDLAAIVEKCVAIKARIVERDEFETRGERALLNFGHTIGHAIEKATGYTRYLHGEAIAIGMRAAAWLSVWHPETRLPEADARRIEDALLANHLPTQIDPAVDRAAILAALGNDKKVASDGGNRWVLLKKLGEAQSGFQLPPDLVAKAVELVKGTL